MKLECTLLFASMGIFAFLSVSYAIDWANGVKGAGLWFALSIAYFFGTTLVLIETKKGGDA